MKKLAIFIIAAGLVIAGYGGFQLMQTSHQQKKSLAEAKALLHQTGDKSADINQTGTAASFHPSAGDKIGVLRIPRINAELPIIEGTDEDELEKGVGHYKTSAFPEENDQIVLSGHRDTVFRHMGELEIGDVFKVHLPYGEFTYKISNTKIVDADDRTVIQSTAPAEVLTVTTCYPFSYIGDAPNRYIITALPVLDGE